MEQIFPDRAWIRAVFLLLASGYAADSAAQTPAPDAAPAAPEAPLAASDAGPTPPPAAAAPECTTACGPSERCEVGRCVSTCDPPCGAGQICERTGACSPPREPKPGAHTHDGFLFRFSSGFTLGTVFVASNDGSGNRSELLLLGGPAVDLGMALAPNWSVHGRLWSELFALRNTPFVHNDRLGLGYFIGVGAGVDYYFMPSNISIGSTLSLAGVGLFELPENDLDLDADDVVLHRSRPGFAIDVDAGKEWWITGNWGVGVGVQVRYVNAAPGRIAAPTSGRLGSVQGSLHVSITYN